MWHLDNIRHGKEKKEGLGAGGVWISLCSAQPCPSCAAGVQSCQEVIVSHKADFHQPLITVINKIKIKLAQLHLQVKGGLKKKKESKNHYGSTVDEARTCSN